MALGSEDGKIWFGAGIDTSQLQRDAAKTEDVFHGIGDTVEKEGIKIDETMKEVGKSLIAVFSIEKAKEFASEVVNVRGEMESLEVVFKTLAGEKVGGDLFKDLKEFSLHTPFLTKDLAEGAKILLSYNISAQDIMPTMKMLGDVSMGDAEHLNSLVMAFGRIESQGSMSGRELREMLMTGFNPLQIISEKTGKSMKELRAEMEKGAITSDMVADALRSATSEGGRFYQMLEKQSQTIKGKISNLKIAVEEMFDSIGENNEELINGVIGSAANVVKHYQDVINVIEDLAVAYGTYKAVLIATAVVQRAVALMDDIKLIIMFRKELGLLTATQQAFNLTALSNPYVIMAAAIAALVTTIYALNKAEGDEMTEANNLKAHINQLTSSTKEEQDQIEKLLPVAKDAKKTVTQRKEAIAQLKKIMPSYFSHLNTETAKNYDVANAIAATNKQLRNKLVLVAKDANLKYQNAKAALATQKSRHNYDSDIDSPIQSHAGAYAIDSGEKEVKALKNAADVANKAVKDFDNSVKVSDEKVEKSKVHNKAYWSKYKDDAEAKLDALSDAAAKGKEGEQYRKQIEAADKKLSSYEVKDPTKTKKTKSTTNVNTVDDSKQKYKDIVERNAITTKELQLKAQDTVTQAKINAMADDSAKVIAQQKYNNAKELQSYREEKENYIKQRIAMVKEEFEAEQDIRAKGNKKYKKQQWAGAAENNAKSVVTTEANKLYDGGEAAIIAKQQLVEIEAARKSMRDYLQEYGTLQEKKLAIAREYAEKIAAAQTEGDKKSLQAERDKKISSLNANQLAGNIDWSVSFKGVGNVLKDVAIETLNKVKDYMKTDEFRALPSDQKKPYLDLKTNLEQETGANSVSPFNFKIWGTISEQVKQYQQSVMDMKKAQDEHTAAVLEYQNALNDLTNATDDTSKALAQKAVDAAKQDVDNTAAVQNDSEDRVNENKDNLKNSTEGAVNGLDNFKNALNNISSGSLYGFANGMTMLITSLSKGSNGIGKSLNELGGKIGGIIGAILQILDALGDDPNKFIDDLLQKLDQTISKIISDLPQIIITIVKDVANIVAAVIGGIGSWFGLNIFGGADYSEYNAAKEKYTALLDVWGKLVDKKKEYLNESWGTEITKTAEEIKTLTDKSIAAYKEMGVARLNSGASIGSHSIGVRQRNGMSDEGWAQLREFTNKYGISYNSIADGRMTGLFDLTTEQIAKLQETAPSFWAQLDDDTKTYLQNIIDAGDSMEETMKKVKEQLLGVSQDSFVDNWLKGLDKLKSGSASIIAEMTSDFGDQMRQQIVDNLIMSKYQTQLKAFYEKWYKGASDASSAGGATVTKQEYEAFMKEYESMTTAAVDDVKGIYDAFGWSYNSATTSGTSASTVNASQDSVDMLTGRATSIDFHAERIENNTITISADVAAIKAAALADSEAITEMRNLSLQAVGHLEKISKNTNELYDIKTSILNIERKVNNL